MRTEEGNFHPPVTETVMTSDDASDAGWVSEEEEGEEPPDPSQASDSLLSASNEVPFLEQLSTMVRHLFPKASSDEPEQPSEAAFDALEEKEKDPMTEEEMNDIIANCDRHALSGASGNEGENDKNPPKKLIVSEKSSLTIIELNIDCYRTKPLQLQAVLVHYSFNQTLLFLLN